MKAQRQSLYDGAKVEAARGMMSLAIATNLPLEVAPSPMVDHFFGGYDSLYRLFEDGFDRGEKSEYWNSNLKMKTLVCDIDFPTHMIRWLIMHHKQKR